MAGGPVAPRLPAEVLAEVDALLAPADAALAAGWPGEPGTRQPVHTVYVPADQATDDIVVTYGRAALAALDEHAPDAAAMARVVDLPGDVVEAVWPRVLAKLDRQPIEDLRVDLEDGYGVRSDDEEDFDAAAAGTLLVGLSGRPGSPFVSGVRIKSLEAPTRERALRSFDLVVGALVDSGGLPNGFVVTLPKVTSVDQVRAMVTVCERLESAYRLATGSLRFEVQVETPQAILGADGTATVARVVHAAEGRCAGLHYGTYDYSAALGIAPAEQSMSHPVADYAKAVMQVAAAGTGVRVSDGSTNLLPVGDRDAVHAAWTVHAGLVTRSLTHGIYQGWDLHPAQLPTRYLATYAFYRAGGPAATKRLRGYVARAHGGVLDEPATALALAAFLLRAVDCGAVDLDEVLAATDLDRTTLEVLARRPPAVLAAFNAMPLAGVRSRLLAVCAAPRWAESVAAGRPYATAEEVLAEADRVLAGLAESEVDAALAGHPRIGDHATDDTSRREQAGVVGADQETLDALAEGNREYERRFGHVYLVCASGRTAGELLDVLRSRLGNDAETERRVLRAELGKINRLRLERLLTDLGRVR
jgi:OHCU decarboxylase